MNQDIRSHSAGPRQRMRDILVPGPAQIILDIILSVFLLAILDAQTIWRYFTTNLLSIHETNVGDFLNEKVQTLTSHFSGLVGGRFLQIIFWAFVGCMAYIAVWMAINVITNLRNDMVVNSYTHPSSLSRKGYWGSIIGLKVLLVCLIVITVAWLIAGLKLTLVLAKAGSDSLQNSHSLRAAIIFTGAVVSTALVIHVLYVLSHITRNTWQAVFHGL